MLLIVFIFYISVKAGNMTRSIGVGLLKDAIRRALMISDQAGIRALLTHPMNEEAAHFYRQFGFESSPLREDQLLLLLKDARLVILY